jgi:glycerol-3-phosphate dehydrogenase
VVGAVNRADGLVRLGEETFDVLVIGGGATGLGAAVDAAARGYRTALVEAEDFAKATSSRSTKLVHGGVRYLQQGEIGLVREALRERTALRANAPHLVHDLAFVVPAYKRTDIAYYGLGLKLYDLLAGRSDFPPSRIVSTRRALELVPALVPAGLHGAVVYSDGQFDDARLAITLARTAVDRGAAVANYVRAVAFHYDGERVTGVHAVDRETGRALEIRARTVINATGIFVDELRSLDDRSAPPLLTYSRGSHIVVRAEALGGATAALLVPKTSDGRILFAVPWHGHVVIGTTDIPTPNAELDPVPTQAEVAFILETVNHFLTRRLAESEVQAAFAGLRPLVNRKAISTAKLSREHVVDVSASGIVSITGGKWTTYRKMAEEVVGIAASRGGLPQKPSPTVRMPLHGATNDLPADDALRVYGSDADTVVSLGRSDAALRAPFHVRLPYTRAEVVHAVRAEMARTVDDVLARRTRALFLDAQAALESAPGVAALLAGELGRDEAWQEEQIRSFELLVYAAQASTFRTSP